MATSLPQLGFGDTRTQPPDKHTFLPPAIKRRGFGAIASRVLLAATCVCMAAGIGTAPANAATTWGNGREVVGPLTQVGPYAVKDVFANCAGGEVPASGGYTQPGNATQNGIVLVNASDPNANRWFVRVKNDSAKNLAIQALVSCYPASSSQLRRVTSTTTWVAPYSVKDVFAYCGANEWRQGGGFIQPGNASQNGIVLSSGFDSNANRWFVRVKNNSGANLPIQAQVTCSSSWYARVVNAPSTTVAPYSTRDVFADCGPGSFRIGGGFIESGNATQDGIALVDGFDPTVNRWFVRIKNNGTAPVQVNAQISCTALLN